MGMFGKLFGGGKTFAPILIRTRKNIFQIYGVQNPTDAQVMRASFHLCIAGMAILNDFGGPGVRGPISKLVEETSDLMQSLSMRPLDLSLDQETVEACVQSSPSNLHVSQSTQINGLVAFNALYQTQGEALIREILEHKDGPMGTPGYAAIKVAEGIFGLEGARKHFMELSMEMLSFATALHRAA